MRELTRRALTITTMVDHLQPLLLVAARLYVSFIFFRSGLLKVHDWSGTLALFRDEYAVPLLPPELAAYVGAFGELFFPILLAFGLAGRVGAAGLFAVNAMAVLSYPQLFTFECPAGINSHFYWGFILVALFAFGPGRISLDALVLRHFGMGKKSLALPNIATAR
jgi:putative oxidoreductase